MLSIIRTRSKLVTVCLASIAMLGMLRVIAAPSLTPSSVPPATHDQPRQSPESFAAAIHDTSTSPIYVLITVVDDKSGMARTGCTTANLLLGAIHIEYGLTYDTAAAAKAQNMALATPSHVFHFSRPEALANVAFRYSPHEMEEARQLIQPLTDQQVREGFAERGELQVSVLSVQDARACALIERGLSVRMADRTGKLILNR